MSTILSTRIERIEWGMLEGKRPRWAGSNARLGTHGDMIHLPIIRLTTLDGSSGFGVSWAQPDQANCLLGQQFETLFEPGSGVNEAWQTFEYPLWDLIGQRSGKPVYALAASIVGKTEPEVLRAACYDTSLYIDDLHLGATTEAADFIAEEARWGYERGHRAF
jgi:L-rhamnonate dehydratase